MSVAVKEHTLRVADTMTAGFNSDPLIRDFMDGYCIAAVLSDFTSTVANLHFNLASSIDGVNYADIGGSTITASNANEPLMWDVDGPKYNYVRVESTMTAGKVTVGITGRSIGYR